LGKPAFFIGYFQVKFEFVLKNQAAGFDSGVDTLFTAPGASEFSDAQQGTCRGFEYQASFFIGGEAGFKDDRNRGTCADTGAAVTPAAAYPERSVRC
jgi:hypothetical protein